MLPAYKYFKIYSINFNYCHLLFIFRFSFFFVLSSVFFHLFSCSFYFILASFSFEFKSVNFIAIIACRKPSKCIINKCDGFCQLIWIESCCDCNLVYCPFAVCCCCCFSWKIRCYYFFGIGNFSHIVHVNQLNKITHWIICCFFFFSLSISVLLSDSLLIKFNFCSPFRHI